MDKPGILIVEDNLIIALDLHERLLRLGYRVLGTVSSGEKAIEKVQQLNPALLLMDISLRGEINGIEAAKIIRQKFNIPIIFITGNSGLLKQAEINDPFINKPFFDQDLIIKINQIASFNLK